MTHRLLSGKRLPISVLIVVASMTLLGLAANAHAGTPIQSYDTLPSNTQAGGHPDIAVSFTLANRIDQQSQSACNCEDVRDATVELPEGFIGNPHAVPQCTLAQFSVDACPIDSQLGIVHVVPSEIFNSMRRSTTWFLRRTYPACSPSRSSSSTPLSSPGSPVGPSPTTVSRLRTPPSTMALPTALVQAGPLGGAGRSQSRPAADRQTVYSR